ncbi:MAG TPA: ATP-binding cassette domain-containing protein [Clostridia bacterium]|nr:MAG: Macrolide export ATP-binding/permease protein MacB [Firmicutes bacterium ADurb.Bin146]HOD92763.1 ATP-binding cassette domain-containing protein [Clostridia bacterium]HQM39533.1 ATP-binding cassette domain-containing protein [Clostridia bacterium]
MLRLKDIKKSYAVGDFMQNALNGVTVSFRKNEFVAILGPSGSGKTTLLNIIGGLDRYDIGDLVINGKSTKNFKDSEWDAYRNNSVGFVFQSYNLIGHISVVQNIELSLTLSGVSKAIRRKKAMDALTLVGLKEHAKKNPSQLSGGQMQRVAIARALVNDPDIILADEPTGALDSETSIQILDLIQNIAKDKLVIMVTHNKEIATKYANRIINLQDGEIVGDTNPFIEELSDKEKYSFKKTAMSFFTALSLSFNNIMTKKGRTILTAFASSIGIIGIALILALSNGFDKQVKNFEEETMSAFPIMISQSAMNVDYDQLQTMRNQYIFGSADDYPDIKAVYPYDPSQSSMRHTNNITEEYISYVENIDPSLVSGLQYSRAINFNLMIKKNGDVGILSSSDIRFSVIPKNLDNNSLSIIETNYDLLSGKYPESMYELVLVVDQKNRVNVKILESLGLDSSLETISFDKILGIQFHLVMNDDLYVPFNDHFIVNSDFQAVYDSKNSVTLNICGIVREKDNATMPILDTGVAYTEELVTYVMENAKNSEVVQKQMNVEYNVFSILGPASPLAQMEKDRLLQVLGATAVPYAISIYPRDFDSKDEVLAYLDAYNVKQENPEDEIIYTDLANMVTTLSGNIMDAITYVLIAFSSISLVVSVIMIGIITYISVLERTKEIGVLRALGARKKDITRVFNAETFIIGMFSGAIGIFIARLLIFPTNIILKNLSNLDNVAVMNPLHALALILISVALTVLGGTIPARLASKRDPVEALRSE